MLDRSNSSIMLRYVSTLDNLMILMNLLRVCVHFIFSLSIVIIFSKLYPFPWKKYGWRKNIFLAFELIYYSHLLLLVLNMLRVSFFDIVISLIFHWYEKGLAKVQINREKLLRILSLFLYLYGSNSCLSIASCSSFISI